VTATSLKTRAVYVKPEKGLNSYDFSKCLWLQFMYLKAGVTAVPS